MKILIGFIGILFLACLGFSSIVAALPRYDQQTTNPTKSILGVENFGKWKNGILEEAAAVDASAPGFGTDEPSKSLVLAAKRTHRLDILRHFRRYEGGWDIRNRHYWASVGFTGATGFILAVLWFISFGLALVVHHCFGCRLNIKGKDSCSAQRICLVMLILFTCAASIGCILLSVGQDEFHSEVLHTLNYVVNRSDYTVQTLRNVTGYLALAKTINVAQIFIPSNVMDDIDKLNVDLNTAADTLSEKTTENSRMITRVFNNVRSALITVAAVMLILAVLGLVLSLLGHKHAIHIFICSGWLLVAMTFILCGIFVIFDNAVSDTCMAMQEWVDNPHAETALGNILPCVDQKTTNHTLIQSKLVINNIVSIVNQFIYTYANADPPHGNPYYYNQSGPLIPTLCYPYDSNLQDRQCVFQEVSMENASSVWQNYTCTLSESGLCTTPGRITPEIYLQLVAAVKESYALEHYTPPLLSLQDCNFVRETFQKITSSFCPPLARHLHIVDAGLGLISVGVMLCLVLWILYANRPQREEVFVQVFSPVKGKFCRFSNGFSSSSCNNINKPTSIILTSEV